MKKKISIILLFLLLFPSQTALEAYGAASAQSYLEAHNPSPWSVMALSALGASQISTDHLKNITGTNAISYEAPILAITSLGQDPRTFGATDYVNALKSYHTNGQLGDTSTLNDDIFGILALISAGVPTSDAVITDSVNYILTHQNADGGWGYAVSSPSDTNTTASAILALLTAGKTSSDATITKALEYLKSSQNNDGGFPYDPKSAYGTDSDSSSTAWVLWALNALGVDPQTWPKQGHNPKDYLEAMQTTSGYFKFQENSSEDNFSPMTTSYAVIALAGKKLPLQIISATLETFDFRIEGSDKLICAGKAAGPTALDIIKNANAQCGYTYHIADKSFGKYLDKINSDEASGSIGWLYFVNYHLPDVGAESYTLKTNDSVVWYFGDWKWQPLRLTLNATEIAHGANVNAKVESFANNSWSSVSDATIYYGTQTTKTDASGQAAFSPADGYYKIFATKDGFVRSNQILVKVGEPQSETVSLGVTIKRGVVLGEQTGGTGQDVISFTVNPASINFGALNPGMNSQKEITIANTGNVAIRVESIVSGDDVFRNYLSLKSMSWQNFFTNIGKNTDEKVPASLTIPGYYQGGGDKSGQITFWAVAQ